MRVQKRSRCNWSRVFKNDSYPGRDGQRLPWAAGGNHPCKVTLVGPWEHDGRCGWIGRCLSSTPGLLMVLLNDDWPLCLCDKAPVDWPRSPGLGAGSSDQRKRSRSASVGSSPGSRGTLSLLIHKH